MHKPEPCLENETHKILWDFEIQTDHQNPTRRPNLEIIDKKRDLAESRILPSQRTTGWKSKKAKKKKGQVLRPCLRTKKTMEHVSKGDTNCNWRAWAGRFSSIWKGDWKNWESEYESRLSRLQYCWNRIEYWEETWRFAVTQTSVKNHQLTLVLKARKKKISREGVKKNKNEKERK